MEPLAVEKFPIDTKQISLLFDLHSIQKNKFSTLLFPKSTKSQDSQLVSLRDLRFSMETGLQSLLFWLNAAETVEGSDWKKVRLNAAEMIEGSDWKSTTQHH